MSVPHTPPPAPAPAPAATPPASPGSPLLLFAAIGAGLAVPLAMLVRARGGISFPLDDAWIHLQYARNLAEHFSFSYFPGGPASSGTTAPLFTLVEAVLLKLLRNEIVTGLLLGFAAHAGFLLALASWALRRTGSATWAAFAVALVALDGRFGLLAVSGMETSLFLFTLALAFLAWSKRDGLSAGLALGAATWVRPEGLVLAGVFALDALLERRAPHRLRAGFLALAGLVALYAGFNLLAGGAPFPSTMAAKSAFYRGTPLAAFLQGDVAATFAGGWWIALPLALAVTLIQLPRLLRRPGDAPASRAEFGWALALVLAYAVVLPFSHRFNRYLVPALPAVAVAAAMALRALAARSGPRTAAAGALAIAALAAQVFYFSPTFDDYRFFARYHLDRHVKAGRWLAEHTPADAVVATHDIGAIAYYSKRRIVDMAGLVTPEVVPHIGQRDYLPFLEDLLNRRGVTQVAVLEEWQPVDNETPRLLADPRPERLRVYDWHPGRTHLLDPGLVTEIDSANAAIDRGDISPATIRVARALNADTLSSRLWMAAGSIRFRQGIYQESVEFYGKALRLYPASVPARAALGVALARMHRVAEARAHLDTLRTMDADSSWVRALEAAIAAEPKR